MNELDLLKYKIRIMDDNPCHILHFFYLFKGVRNVSAKANFVGL